MREVVYAVFSLDVAVRAWIMAEAQVVGGEKLYGLLGIPNILLTSTARYVLLVMFCDWPESDAMFSGPDTRYTSTMNNRRRTGAVLQYFLANTMSNYAIQQDAEHTHATEELKLPAFRANEKACPNTGMTYGNLGGNFPEPSRRSTLINVE